MNVRNLQTERRKEVLDLLCVLFGGTRDHIHVNWTPMIEGHGFKLVSISRDTDRAVLAPAYVPLIPQRLSVSFEEAWIEPRLGPPMLQSSRLVIHDHDQDMRDVFVLEAEPTCSTDDAPTHYKRGWHVHLKELPSPWSKLHLGLFPRVPSEKLNCFDASQRTELNAKMRRVLRMLWVELVGRNWTEWKPNEGR